MYEDMLSTLIEVKHTCMVQAYVDEFEITLTHASLISKHSLSIFLDGLEHNIQMYVRMFIPAIISHAVNLAKLHGSNKEKLPRAPFNRNTSQNTKPNPFPTQKEPNTAIKPLFNRTNRSYATVEMADRRAKGLCMFCDEKLTPGHQLKHRKPQMFVLELEEDDGESFEPNTET